MRRINKRALKKQWRRRKLRMRLFFTGLDHTQTESGYCIATDKQLARLGDPAGLEAMNAVGPSSNPNGLEHLQRVREHFAPQFSPS